MTLIFSLVGGLAIALIIQLLFASLGIALGLTVLNFSPKPSQPPKNDENKDTQSKLSLPITHLIGFGIALGISSIIFITAFISTDFSAIVQPRRGIIFGIIFWAVYWTLLIWLSTTAVAGIVDSLFGGAIASLKQIVATFKKETNTQASDEDSLLQGLTGELSQIIDAQQALPALLASQREALVKEISDRTQLSPTQTETILTEITPTEPQPLPSDYTTNSSSSLISKIESTLDLPSWQQISQNILDQIDFSEIESLVYQIPSRLQDKDAESQQSSQASAIQSEVVTKVSLPALETPQEQAAVSKKIQNKLIAYCRYTNVDLLTPENLTAKIEDQAEEHSIALANVHIDVATIEDILSRRKGLAPERKQALVNILEPTRSLETAPAEPSEEQPPAEETSGQKTEISYPQKVQQALENSIQSIEWKEVLAPSINGAGNLGEQIKEQIFRYLQTQDKLAFHPVQIAKDLTHIVGHGLRQIPHPSELPSLSELETLWDKGSWQQALENRKDLTVAEIQEILAWGEAAWEPVVKQSGLWLVSLQSQADQLLSLVDSTALDTAREKIVEQIGLAKETLDEQAAAVKIEIQTQADAARRQGAIAAWWLFIALLGSGLASGGAGWLAIIY